MAQESTTSSCTSEQEAIRIQKRRQGLSWGNISILFHEYITSSTTSTSSTSTLRQEHALSRPEHFFLTPCQAHQIIHSSYLELLHFQRMKPFGFGKEQMEFFWLENLSNLYKHPGAFSAICQNFEEIDTKQVIEHAWLNETRAKTYRDSSCSINSREQFQIVQRINEETLVLERHVVDQNKRLLYLKFRIQDGDDDKRVIIGTQWINLQQQQEKDNQEDIGRTWMLVDRIYSDAYNKSKKKMSSKNARYCGIRKKRTCNK